MGTAALNIQICPVNWAFEKLDRKIRNRALGWVSGTRKWLPVAVQLSSGLEAQGRAVWSVRGVPSNSLLRLVGFLDSCQWTSLHCGACFLAADLSSGVVVMFDSQEETSMSALLSCSCLKTENNSWQGEVFMHAKLSPSSCWAREMHCFLLDCGPPSDLHSTPREISTKESSWMILPDIPWWANANVHVLECVPSSLFMTQHDVPELSPCLIFGLLDMSQSMPQCPSPKCFAEHLLGGIKGSGG